jgi:YD repeat-containing protein
VPVGLDAARLGTANAAWIRPMRATALSATILLVFATATSAQANGRITTTITTDSNGQRTFRDGSGRMTGTATTDSNGTTFRDGSGRTTGTALTPRR